MANYEYDPERKAPLNRTAVAGIFVSAALAVVGLFLLPSLRGLGLSFSQAFWLLCGVEFVAAMGAGYSVLNLHADTPEERVSAEN
jgi:hypothetical protein